MEKIRGQLPTWPPGDESDDVQCVRNILCVAGVPDAIQQPIERYLPLVVLQHLLDSYPKDKLVKILTWIALRSRRYWPLLAAALQTLAVGAPLAKAADAGVTGWAYLTAALAFQYLALMTIGYGAVTAPRRYAEMGAADAPNDVPGATRR